MFSRTDVAHHRPGRSTSSEGGGPDPLPPKALQFEETGDTPYLRRYEDIVRTLMVVRGLAETERLVLDLLCTTFGAEWAAFYSASDDDYVCRSTVDLDLDEIADIPRAVVFNELHRSGPIALADDSPLQKHAPSRAAIGAVIHLQKNESGLVLLGQRNDERTLGADIPLLTRLIEYSAVALQNAQVIDELRAQVSTDFLTSCYNRRGFEDHLRVELSRARRYQHPLSLLLVDLDEFKRVNDRFGHPVGDYALRTVGKLLRQTFRTSDRVCRYGGDEFALIFPETDRDEAVMLAERLRAKIANSFPDERISVPITASLGVAAFPDDATDAESLIAEADRALYRAKFRGKDQVSSS